MKRLQYLLLTLLLPGLLHAVPDPDEVKKEQEAVRNRILWRLEEKDYEFAEKQCREALKELKQGDPLGGKLHGGRVRFYLANSLEGQGRQDDALKEYAHIWATQMGMVSVSAPSMESWMKILWKRNAPARKDAMSDRKGAVEAARRYIELTSPFKDKMKKDDLEKWLRVEKLLRAYEAELEKQ